MPHTSCAVRQRQRRQSTQTAVPVREQWKRRFSVAIVSRRRWHTLVLARRQPISIVTWAERWLKSSMYHIGYCAAAAANVHVCVSAVACRKVAVCFEISSLILSLRRNFFLLDIDYFINQSIFDRLHLSFTFLYSFFEIMTTSRALRCPGTVISQIYVTL